MAHRVQGLDRFSVLLSSVCVCALSVIPQPFAELRGLRQASVGLQGAGFGLEDKLAAV